LKHDLDDGHQLPPAVAPVTGAWIETARYGALPDRANVAPVTGAWIETLDARTASATRAVAPVTGAWIETWAMPQRR